jgi:hypothetical protein
MRFLRVRSAASSVDDVVSRRRSSSGVVVVAAAGVDLDSNHPELEGLEKCWRSGLFTGGVIPIAWWSLSSFRPVDRPGLGGGVDGNEFRATDSEDALREAFSVFSC